MFSYAILGQEKGSEMDHGGGMDHGERGGRRGKGRDAGKGGGRKRRRHRGGGGARGESELSDVVNSSHAVGDRDIHRKLCDSIRIELP